MENPDISRILQEASDGDSSAAARLLPIVYAQLRATAQKAMASERPDHTLQATALVHEAYAKLVHGAPIDWVNRAHFYDAAARAMRQILIDHARSKSAEKRGGGAARMTIDQACEPAAPGPNHAAKQLDVLALDEALRKLAEVDPRQARIVELRMFGGLTVDEVADAIEMSPRTVELDWRMARAWLSRALGGDDRG